MRFEMEKNLRNKRILQTVLIFMCVAVVAAGITLVTTMRSGSSSAAAMGVSGTPSDSTATGDTGTHAKALYNDLVSDAGDSAAVAKLLETMGLEASVGKYKVTVDQSGKNYVMTVDISEAVKAEDREAFDAVMMDCGEQMLALITNADKVIWNYPVTGDQTGDKTKATDESVSVSLDTSGAAESTGNDIKSFGKSASAVKELLDLQAQE